MESRFRILGHPVHPMLIVFPSALFPLLVVLDGLHWYFGDAAFWTVGFWIAVGGVLTTLAAMVPGIVDLAKIPNASKAHRVALWHLVIGTGVLVLYAAAVWARWPVGSGPDRFLLATTLDVLGTLAVTAQGWLGGELVYKFHLAVQTEAEGAEPTPFETGEGSARGGSTKRRPEMRP